MGYGGYIADLIRLNVAGNCLEVVADAVAPLPDVGDLSAYTAVITGGNAGIGLATAEALVVHGAHVVLACRSPERGRHAAQASARRAGLPAAGRRPPLATAAAGHADSSPHSLQKLFALEPAPGCKKGGVSVEECDLTSVDSVGRFCDRRARGAAAAPGGGARVVPLVAAGGADLLVLNAGVMAPPKRQETRDGFELQFQARITNCSKIVLPRARWLIANRLAADCRRRRRGGERVAALRAIFLSSMTHWAGEPRLCRVSDPEDLAHAHRYNGLLQYASTKLACLLAAREMARRLDGAALAREPGIEREAVDTAVAIHPGLVDTWLARTFFKQCCPEFLRPVTDPLLDHVLCPLFLRKPASAARTVLLAATAPEEEAAGRYYAGRGLRPSTVADPSQARQLWEFTRELCIKGGVAEADLL
eukprot:scaffold12.g8263.t1